MFAVFVTHIAHHHWSNTAGTTVDDGHGASVHLCRIWDQLLLACQVFFKVSGAHGEKNSLSHVFRQLVSSAFSVALFQIVPRLGLCVRDRLFGRLSVETRFACCRPATNGSCKAAGLRKCSKPGSRSAPRTISRASPSVLKIKNVAILGPSRLPH